jgi:hypothetical protein
MSEDIKQSVKMSAEEVAGIGEKKIVKGVNPDTVEVQGQGPYIWVVCCRCGVINWVDAFAPGFWCWNCGLPMRNASF